MPFKLANRARMTVAAAPGTGSITLGVSVPGHQTFAQAGLTEADTTAYVIEDGAAWEIGTGTYSAGSTTLGRTTLVQSSTGSRIDAGASAQVYISPHAATLTGFSLLRTTVLTSSGKWTRSPHAKLCFIELIGGGGGGGSGRRSALATTSGNVCGGAGAQGGCVTHMWMAAEELPASIDVLIGAGGAGGIAQTQDTTNGMAGNSGGSTFMIFASDDAGYSIQFAAAGGGSGGNGGTNSTAVGGPATKPPGFSAQNYTNTGGQGRTGSSDTGIHGGGGGTSGGHGGGGRGHSDGATTSFVGGSGSYGQKHQYSGAGVIYAENGGTIDASTGLGGPGGTPSDARLPFYGTGGGGGGSASGQTTSATSGGAGGNGAIPGGAGGGGGSGKGANSGKGGDGARGEVRVYEFG